MNVNVANPLTLVMKCRDEQAFAEIKAKITGLLGQEENPINKALDAIGTVHFARFVFFEETKQVAVITTYDGDFRAYILRFTEKIGDVFNLLLTYVEDTDAMKGPDGKVNVQKYPDDFVKFVEKYDLRAVEPFYSAYPDLTVQDIKQLQRIVSE